MSPSKKTAKKPVRASSIEPLAGAVSKIKGRMAALDNNPLVRLALIQRIINAAQSPTVSVLTLHSIAQALEAGTR